MFRDWMRFLSGMKTKRATHLFCSDPAAGARPLSRFFPHFVTKHQAPNVDVSYHEKRLAHIIVFDAKLYQINELIGNIIYRYFFLDSKRPSVDLEHFISVFLGFWCWQQLIVVLYRIVPWQHQTSSIFEEDKEINLATGVILMLKVKRVTGACMECVA